MPYDRYYGKAIEGFSSTVPSHDWLIPVHDMYEISKASEANSGYIYKGSETPMPPILAC